MLSGYPLNHLIHLRGVRAWGENVERREMGWKREEGECISWFVFGLGDNLTV